MKTLLILLASVSLSGCLFGQPNYTEIDVNKVDSLVKSGALFIDVREKDEVAEIAYNIEGAVNIPMSELSSRLSEIPTNQPLILACRSGKRSKKAIDLLSENGYTNLRNLTGGMLEWDAQKLPVLRKI